MLPEPAVEQRGVVAEEGEGGGDVCLLHAWWELKKGVWYGHPVVSMLAGNPSDEVFVDPRKRSQMDGVPIFLGGRTANDELVA